MLRKYYRTDLDKMKKYTCYYKKVKIAYIKMAIFVSVVAALFIPGFVKFESTGDNLFTVKLNGVDIGKVADVDELQDEIQKVRGKIAAESDELVFIDTDIEVEADEVLFGRVDSDEDIRSNIEKVLRDSVKETLQRAYTVKVNEYTVNLASAGEVVELLQASIDKYATEDKFSVTLAQDNTREFNVLTTNIVEKKEAEEEITYAVDRHGMREGGISQTLSEMFEAIEPAREKDWDDFEYGLASIGFAEEVEVVESYISQSDIKSLSAAIEEVTKEQEKNTVYEVQSGDTLSGISMSTNIPLDRLIELNENLKDENSIIRVGDELIVTVPEPELSIVWEEEAYYEEEYEADIIYVYNDDWYTTQTKTLQEPSAGFRKIVAKVQYRNDKEVAREIVKEEVVMEAVAKIVEKGTKIPPTYIKPISGGRLSSGFGRRTIPTKGATAYHQGIDWATPTGTAVFASSGGTVARAGWSGSYGYAVYINHADGRQTRYAHLSKVLVKAGQTVSQGQRIALSGNTGVSSGPHVHFEILINGSRVNPLKYLN